MAVTASACRSCCAQCAKSFRHVLSTAFASYRLTPCAQSSAGFPLIFTYYGEHQAAFHARDLQVLGWTAKRDIKDMCRDQWNWASTHPDGYGKK